MVLHSILTCIKYILVLSFALILETIQSQPGLNHCCYPGIEWTEVEFSGFQGGATSMRYTYDSIPVIQNGKTYYEILSSTFETGGNWINTHMLIRFEDSKIYKATITGEDIIVDFNLKIDDVFVPQWGGELTVVAIDTIVLANGESSKRLKLHCELGGDFYWIEGVGTTSGLASDYGACVTDVGSVLLCLWENDILLYDNPEYNTCWLNIVSTDDFPKNNISFSPNPVNDILNITDPIERIASVYIIDLIGNVVYSGSSLHIEIKDLPSGYYLLQLELKDGEKHGEKFIKL